MNTARACHQSYLKRDLASQLEIEARIEYQRLIEECFEVNLGSASEISVGIS